MNVVPPLGLSVVLLGLIAPAIAAQPADPSPANRNPISRLARWVSPKLAEVEQRIDWLEREVFTLAKHEQFPLRYHIGYRGHRATPNSEDPHVTLDLGRSLPIDQIFLIPCELNHLNDQGIFPQRYTLEVANSEDFSDSRIIHGDDAINHQHFNGSPVYFSSEFEGRYVRLSVQQGHNKGALDLFGLSEIFIFSGGEPVSFNAKILTEGALNKDAIWHPDALVDGRTPLGIWHHGKAAELQLGDAVTIDDVKEPTIWRLNLPAHDGIDRVVLFPYQVKGSHDISIFPQSLEILATNADGSEETVLKEWSNPLPGTNQLSPMVFGLGGHEARHLTIRASTPWSMGQHSMNALSEIEVWSAGRNLATGIPITRLQGNEKLEVASLTDGFSSEKNIAPIHIWLTQIIQRAQIERELQALRSVYGQLSTRGELNVSWGAAVILGMTFLIPVFIFERKRMRSKEHLDTIRKRIAADLHDDIGSNLGSISLIARTARKDLVRLNGPKELDDDLGEVELIARESSLAMRDIVWLLERKQDSIGDLIHRMRETAGRLLRGINLTLECSSTRTASRLTLDAKRHLFLFYKEAIHNIVKHSEADKVTIKLWDEGDSIAMEIIDNGVGIPAKQDHLPVSIKKLKERAEVLGGSLQLNSAPDSGTRILLLVQHLKLTNPTLSQ